MAVSIKKYYPIKGRKDFYKYYIVDNGKIATDSEGKQMYFQMLSDAKIVANARKRVNKLRAERKKEAKKKSAISLTSLRKKFPKAKLGFRERTILSAPGAKLTKANSYGQGIYRVTHGSKFFLFTLNRPGYNNFTVIG